MISRTFHSVVSGAGKSPATRSLRAWRSARVCSISLSTGLAGRGVPRSSISRARSASYSVGGSAAGSGRFGISSSDVAGCSPATSGSPPCGLAVLRRSLALARSPARPLPRGSVRRRFARRAPIPASRTGRTRTRRPSSPAARAPAGPRAPASARARVRPRGRAARARPRARPRRRRSGSGPTRSCRRAARRRRRRRRGRRRAGSRRRSTRRSEPRWPRRASLRIARASSSSRAPVSAGVAAALPGGRLAAPELALERRSRGRRPP